MDNVWKAIVSVKLTDCEEYADFLVESAAVRVLGPLDRHARALFEGSVGKPGRDRLRFHADLEREPFPKREFTDDRVGWVPEALEHWAYGLRETEFGRLEVVVSENISDELEELRQEGRNVMGQIHVLVNSG